MELIDQWFPGLIVHTDESSSREPYPLSEQHQLPEHVGLPLACISFPGGCIV